MPVSTSMTIGFGTADMISELIRLPCVAH
jgi:hypothetical protein